MVSSGAQDFTKWWVALFPGLAIVSFALAFNFIGDALRDLMDPGLRRLL
jgi:peptide/nickel transport system permease protein